MIDNLQAGSIKASCSHLLTNGHTHCIGDSLSQRACRCFHPVRFTIFRMPRRLRTELSKLLQVIQGELVSGQMQEGIKQHRAMTTRQDKAIPVGPAGVGGVVPHPVEIEDRSDIRQTQRSSWMSRVGFLDRVGGQSSDYISNLFQMHGATSLIRYETLRPIGHYPTWRRSLHLCQCAFPRQSHCEPGLEHCQMLLPARRPLVLTPILYP